MIIYLYYDADNFSHKRFSATIRELKQKYPDSHVVTKAYGDFTNCLENWNKLIPDYAIQIIHYPMVAKKILTDTFLISDALEDLYTKNLDIIALASDDIDFFPLIKKSFEKNKQTILFTQNGYALNNIFKEYLSHYIHVLENQQCDMYDPEFIKNHLLLAVESVKNNNNESDLGEANIWLKTNIENFDIKKAGFSKILKAYEKDGRFIITKIADKCMLSIKEKKD